jgi:hypothetical protein
MFPFFWRILYDSGKEKARENARNEKKSIFAKMLDMVGGLCIGYGRTAQKKERPSV